MERMRERAGRGPSFVDQMVGESKDQRNYFKIIDKKTGKLIETGQGPNNGINSWVEVVPGSNVLIIHHAKKQNDK